MGVVTIVSDNAGWRAILLTAVEGTPAEHQLQPVLGALDLAFVDPDRLLPSRITALFADEAMTRPLITAVLARAIDRLEGDCLAAARAVLACLPAVLEELTEAVTGAEAQTSVLLSRLLALETAYGTARMARRMAGSPYICPRCASGHVLEHHNTANGGVVVDLSCELCGEDASFGAGDPRERRWRRGA